MGYTVHNWAPNMEPAKLKRHDIVAWLHDFWDWWASYTLSIFLLFYDQLDTIVSVGGFVLLIIRLIADGPRAYKTLKDYFNGK